MIQERSCHGGLRADSLQLVPVVPHRLRWWIALVAAAFALTLVLGLWRSSQMPSPEAEPSNAPAAIDWGTVMADPAPAAEPLLQVGAYITNISDIDLREDQFPSNCCCGPSGMGIRIRTPVISCASSTASTTVISSASSGSAGSDGRLAGACTRCGHRGKRWRLQRYPFDDQLLHVEIGLMTLQPVNLDLVAGTAA